ncbi:Threonine/homoserine/homoserine lactone efflux protein [Burkholderia sp. YR290]|jgi:threonine/homoserine/homoserine lactone efflux protein|uniref:LysE family translocator n=1 Tax=Paraburkholderia hospita TaxID=169430 RepID=UPI0009A8AF0E|nr:LysE family transporter [Paraburkholderia hospita]SKC96164.1 Threonine/homoserine/homoserine lactone efflux protein [Burkholderia sp. CF099]SKC97335.1 Threonine/homoserine/homoserine lactone efflux protein [Paraburkholderia hospita]SOE89981.1 Threonine/homoserine/homoserine lactone efflux protein [Burkholderia sp. YR290]
MLDPINSLLALCGVLLLSVASPGPNFVIVTSTAVASRRAGVSTGLGLAAASGTWALIAIAGLSLIVTHVAWIETALRIAGAAYLIWLGAKMIVTARQPLSTPARTAGSGWAAAKRGYFVSMTNPKSIAFYGSIFAVMVPAHAAISFDIAVVALSIGISCAWYCAMAMLASHPAIRGFMVRRKAVIDTTAGVLLIGLGGRMLAGR